jgi:hypothetical protein
MIVRSQSSHWGWLAQWPLEYIVTSGSEVTSRPIVEAFLHARYFLEMAVRYGRELKATPMPLPSGLAALLYLYDLR